MIGSAAFVSSLTAETPTRGGTLIAALNSNVRNLNSAVQSGTVTGFPGAQLFASPLRYDENWTPQPYLAESWNISEDGLTVTLNLVKNATFHDGHPITSSDVAFSVKVIQENHPFSVVLFHSAKSFVLNFSSGRLYFFTFVLGGLRPPPGPPRPPQ